MSSVRIKSVTKKYKDVTAVNKMDLSINDGEFFILLGPSGAGKTTTLRLVSGLETPDGGEVFIDEVVVNNIPPALRDVAFIFQHYSLYPNLTVRQNFEFPLESNIRKVSEDEKNKKVKEVAKTLHIDHLLDRRVDKLSGGEMQRVSIGRAIVRSPKVFLMDEPLSNLDAKLREEMRAELKRLQVDMGSTIFFVTHDQIEAMTMGDRIAVLNNGKILQIGTPEDIYNDPGDLFVAQLVGSPTINIFEPVVDEKNIIIEQNHIDYIPNESQKKFLADYKGKQVNLCIRPEDIILSRTKNKGDNYICEVYIVENMGMENIISFKSDKVLFKALTPPTFEVKVGDKVNVSFKKEMIYFFDKDTGKRIN